MSHFLTKETTIYDKDLNSSSIKNAIKILTDEDFNGNNGKDYYTQIEIDGKLVSMSELDAMWLKETAGKTDEEIVNDVCVIIESIVSSNYEKYYYEDSIVRVIETNNSIVCIVACMYSL